MKQKPPTENCIQLQSLKEILFNIRFEISKGIKSKQWNCENIKKICQKLKNNKARDVNGLIFELFKPDKCGSDLHNSLTHMFNIMKNQTEVPDFMRDMTITDIYANKGSKFQLTNQRGLFGL